MHVNFLFPKNIPHDQQNNVQKHTSVLQKIIEINSSYIPQIILTHKKYKALFGWGRGRLKVEVNV